MADIFIKENSDFIEQCMGNNEACYYQMISSLEEEELPYAFDIGERFFLLIIG
ncbi:hypothetical protein BN863_11250 [Formosa agariphila KMM 3901]|uniref:Uncharacterized protein n=1 Tax=Formosa agariphila (strain DSM 15362 / KCTC 12365 / LMG 23005 / KMM 3901 / M-2Alg 35-1) TaxID=1347342 RepID=T2KIY6_FORAG|nr:hypothetical protein BN863_11250 [Formosa agariphila KMM 3901]